MNKLLAITKILFLSVLLIAPLKIYANQNSIQINLGAGSMMLKDMDKFNERLERQGYDTFDSRYITTGGHIRLNLGNFFIGGERYGFRSETTRTGSYEYFVRGGYSLIETGYYFHVMEKIRFYPLVGIGRGDIVLSIYERNSSDFDDVIFNPGRGVDVSQGFLLLNISIGIDYFIQIIQKGGFIIALQCGYNQEITDANWDMFQEGRNTGTDINNGPDISFSGFAGHISIGWMFIL